MQPRIIFSLVELTEGPGQEITGPASMDRKIARAHVKELQGMVAAKGNAPPERGTGFDHMEAEWLLHTLKAGDRGCDAGEAAADHA